MNTNSRLKCDALAPESTDHLSSSERLFLNAIHALGFGRFEFLRIDHGEIVLDPWPTCVRDVKFRSNWTPPETGTAFLLKPQVTEFFQYVRQVDAGEIRTLEVKHGLPFSMEIEHRPEATGGRRG